MSISVTNKPLSKSSNSISIPHESALQLILSAEAGRDHPEQVEKELPAIITHWLQNPKSTPILLTTADGNRWESILRRSLSLQKMHPALGEPKPTKHKKPLKIEVSNLPFPPPSKPQFTFIDLFAGIGGFHIALENSGGVCLFASEWENQAKLTYYNNYGLIPFGDITNFTNCETPDSLESIPSHDILCAGFPCQPFSQAGKQLGFDDARGTLFFDILTIAKEKRPKVLFLENVKRLKGHDKGKTFKIICNSLSEIGYKVYAKVVRAYDHGVPQNRERIFIVAFSEPIHFEFPSENRHSLYSCVGDILEPQPDTLYTISDKLWAGHQRRLAQHKEKGNGFGYSLFKHEDKYVNTISARYWKDGSEILIKQQDQNPRILTPRECARIQGYPENFQPHEAKRHAYQQFGNSVAVPVIEAITSQIIKSLQKREKVRDLTPSIL